ncbi:phage tail terminator family protein [Paenibacillus sp. y28]|uniref:phage tail terminator family protein n=1 Tax=Paenibacillus sp. y28 TaxID=3129110 RepID=UPI0030198830
MSVTVQDVIDGVVAALAAAYPEARIYAAPADVLVAPYYLVGILECGQTRETGRRYLRTHKLDVQVTAGTASELLAAAEGLYTVLSYVTIGGLPCRGKGMKHQVTEGVLHFTVEFDFHVLQAAEALPKMQEYTHKGAIKQ